VIEGIRKTLSNEKDVLILVVDDGSTDKTVTAAENSGADIIVCHDRNLGVAHAYKTAICTALEYGADIICTIDGDGQFQSDQIPSLIDPIRNGNADLVIGSRFVDPKNNNGVPTINKVANKFMALFVSFIIGQRLHDTESGFRAISRDAASKLKLLGMVSFSNDMILDLSFKNQTILEVPVSVKYFDTRVSRVITSFLKYGLKSLCLISLKVLSTKLNFNRISEYKPCISIALSPGVKAQVGAKD
jgi:glycosyltransferase involved in cell wall biosynthesis